jgi:hypothetical protein
LGTYVSISLKLKLVIPLSTTPRMVSSSKPIHYIEIDRVQGTSCNTIHLTKCSYKTNFPAEIKLLSPN